jgi:Leucine-rich repeat (LRR) protein
MQLHADALRQLVEHSPGDNGRLAMVSQAMRGRLSVLDPKPPLWFHVLLDTYPAMTDRQRRASMLSELQMQARRFRLLSIETPGFDVDEDMTVLQPLGHERGGPRLGAVLAQHCAALESLDLSRTGIAVWREIRTGLRSCPELQRVNLNGSTFTRGNNPFNALALCGKLRELVLEDSEIGIVCRQLAPVLAQCTALTKLSLANNRLSYVESDAAGQITVPPVCVLQRLTDALRHHPSLQHLDLTGCSLNPPCIRLLVAALPTMLRLERLILASNELTVIRIGQLGAMLVQCPSMRHLDVRDNDIGDPGLLALVASQGLRGLASLDVSHCQLDCIGPGGRAGTTGPQVQFLAELALCPRLQALDLSGCALGGGTFPLALLKQLPALRALSLWTQAGSGSGAGSEAALLEAEMEARGGVVVL